MLIFVMLGCNHLNAQNNADSVWKYSSPFFRHCSDIRDNPSQLHLLPINSMTTITISNNYFNSLKDTAYNIYEGNRHNYTDILAKGYRKNKNGSTISGFGMLKKDYNSDVIFNSIANYRKFYPYIVGVDSKNDVYKESYSIGGSYSHKFKSLHIGTFASYLGGIFYGISDPRAENKFSEIQISLGISFDIDKYNLGFYMKYLRYNESLDIIIKKTGIKDFFYSMRGLGLYDYQYSQLSESFSRFIKNDGVILGISLYENDIKGIFSNINMIINNSKNIEPSERITSELNDISGNIKIGYILNNDKHNLTVSNNFDYKYAVGTENIYNKYYVHRNPDIIDYKLFVSKKDESIRQLCNKTSIIYQYVFDKNNILEITGDNIINKYKESYKQYFADYLYINQQLSMGYKFATNKNYLSAYLSYGYKRNLGNNILMPQYENSKQLTYMTKYFEYMYKSSNCFGCRFQYIRPIYQNMSLAMGVEYVKNYGNVNFDNIETKLTFIF